MKPKSFRHLTARSRKRVLRRLCRQWQDLFNEIKYLESERDLADRYAAAMYNVRIMFATRKLAQLEHLLS